MDWNIITQDEVIETVTCQTPHEAALTVKERFADGATFIIASPDRAITIPFSIEYKHTQKWNVIIEVTNLSTGKIIGLL